MHQEKSVRCATHTNTQFFFTIVGQLPAEKEWGHSITKYIDCEACLTQKAHEIVQCRTHEVSHVLLKMRKASKSAAIVLDVLQSTRSQESDAFKDASRSINCTNVRAKTTGM